MLQSVSSVIGPPGRSTDRDAPGLKICNITYYKSDPEHPSGFTGNTKIEEPISNLYCLDQ
jgi:hypothetical protein